MSNIDFPTAPINGQVFSAGNGVTYRFVSPPGIWMTDGSGTTYAPIDSPHFTGNPTAPTPIAGDNDTTIATTQFVNALLFSLSPAASVVRTTVFTASGTYTPNANMVYCKVQGWGAGGAGGSTVTGPASLFIGAGGGAAGSWAKAIIAKATIGVSQVVTIGAAAALPASGNVTGGTGGDTSLGALLVAKGGLGGQGQPTAATGGLGGLGVVAGNVGDESGPGMAGGSGMNLNSQVGCSNGGGSATPIGAGGRCTPGSLTTFSNGEAAIGFASGGGGGGSYNAGGVSRGGVGTGGYLVIEEYCTS